MSKTNRQMKRLPREREFPYIPRGVPVLQVGPPNGADDNQAYVRSLHSVRYPTLTESYNEAIEAPCGAGCQIG